MKKLALILSFSLISGFSRCTGGGIASDGGNSSQSASEQIKQEEMLYHVDDVVKPDLIWDTETLFATKPEVVNSDVFLGNTIQAFKFRSAPYGTKKNTWVFAAIGVPTSEMPEEGYPAVVLVHGGGGTVSKNWINYWTEQGYVALAFDNTSGELNQSGEKIDNLDGGPKNDGSGSNREGVEKPEQTWMYHAVYNTIMSNNILRGRSDVDKNRIVLTGTSWGGYIACVTAGVDKRFAAFASTNGCGYVYDDTTWQKDGVFGGIKKDEWISLYDPSSYLPYATKPMLFVSGVDDEYFSAYNRQRSADLVKGKVFYSQRTNIKHAAWDKEHEIHAFFQHVLYEKNSLTLISDVTTVDNVATFTYENKKFKKVFFVYTTSTEKDSHQWEWETVELTAENGTYSYEIPEDTTAYLFETYSDPTFGQSTNMVFTDPNGDYQ